MEFSGQESNCHHSQQQTTKVQHWAVFAAAQGIDFASLKVDEKAEKKHAGDSFV